MDDAISTLQLLQAMYPLPGELELSDAASAALAASEAGDPAPAPTTLDAVVRVVLDEAADPADPEVDAVYISISLPPSAGVRIVPRQPPFLTRAAYDELCAALPEPGGDDGESVLAAIEAVRATAPGLIVTPEASPEPIPEGDDDGPLERVWFWFPSLSTREKRKDMCTYAPRHRLTGFVLAGKPALLCLEGGGKAVDRYMSEIKAVSWSDVPSFQKKVTERLRRPLQPTDRRFESFSDITNLLTYHGTYNHRGDMGEVKKLMDQWGVGDDFAGAVLNAS